MTESFRERKK